MKFNDQELSFLKGHNFSNSLKVGISGKKNKFQTRMEYIEEVVANKNVVHLGCTDHIPLIKEKIKNSIWFHKRLDEVASRCLGVDIDEESLAYVKKEFGYNDLINHNMLTDEPHPAIIQDHWDYLVMGEILEHVDNPVLLLSTINQKYAGSIDTVIISVPNAFDIKNFWFGLQHKEFINTDHRFWFTPFTLAKVVMAAGLEVENFEFCVPGYFPKRKFFQRFLLKKYPALRETLVMTCKLVKKGGD